MEQSRPTGIGCGLGELFQEPSTTLEKYLDGFFCGLTTD